jgi:hypothetical protein
MGIPGWSCDAQKISGHICEKELIGMIESWFAAVVSEFLGTRGNMPNRSLAFSNL